MIFSCFQGSRILTLFMPAALATEHTVHVRPNQSTAMHRSRCLCRMAAPTQRPLEASRNRRQLCRVLRSRRRTYPNGPGHRPARRSLCGQPRLATTNGTEGRNLNATARAILDELFGAGRWCWTFDAGSRNYWLGNGTGRRFLLTESELCKRTPELTRLIRWRHEQVITSPRPMFRPEAASLNHLEETRS